MKLLTKSSLYFLSISLIVFLLGGISVYFLMQNIIQSEIDESLEDRQTDFLWELKQVKGFDNIILPLNAKIQIRPVAKDIFEPLFKDTLLFNDVENEFLPFRYIKFNGAYSIDKREITIYQSLIEDDDLIETIVYALLIVFFITLIAIAALNFFGMRHLWHPFNKILEQIKRFDFRKKSTIEQIVTDIDEFMELNHALIKMSEKLTRDYAALKEFSENASHEMQTPLAIIQSKLELIFQKQDLGEETLSALNGAYQAANRLSKLHHELNLLSRIENQEYKELDSININDMLNNLVENFTDIIELKNISLEKNTDPNIVIDANSYLLETLFSNLLGNAIKHNLAAGKIAVDLNATFFSISNTGTPPQIAPHDFFERFKKGNAVSDSPGLGLSIVKQICSYHNFAISYTFENGFHKVEVRFK